MDRFASSLGLTAQAGMARAFGAEETTNLYRLNPTFAPRSHFSTRLRHWP